MKKIFEKITYSKKWTEWRAKVSQCRKTEREDNLRFFNIHSVAKHEKIEENKNFHFREKISMPKKSERGDPLGFFNIHSVAKHLTMPKKCRGDPLEKFFFEKKSRSAEKNERGESLVSSGMVCYAEKQEKPFWFSSLDQIVHFDAIIFCRTFVELFWSVRVDRKTRRERLKSALYLRLKKRKRLFFEFFSFGKCRIVPRNVKGGTLWALLTYTLLQNIKKLERWTLLIH